MRQTFAIATGLVLTVQSFVAAQNPSAENLKALQEARTELDGLRAELRTLKENCGIKTIDRSATISGATRQVILRRYRWVPASSVAGQQAIATGLTTTGVTAFQGSNFGVQSQLLAAPSSFVDVQSSSLITNNFAAPGFVTGLSGTFATGSVGARSFAPATSNVLPSSPYAAHRSYDVYSNGPVIQSFSAGVSAAPVYPTATFRGTGGFVTPVPTPHYSAY